MRLRRMSQIFSSIRLMLTMAFVNVGSVLFTSTPALDDELVCLLWVENIAIPAHLKLGVDTVAGPGFEEDGPGSIGIKPSS